MGLADVISKKMAIVIGIRVPRTLKELDDIWNSLKSLDDKFDALTFSKITPSSIDPLASSVILLQRTPIEILYQLECKKKNKSAVMSEVLTLINVGIRSVVVSTGTFFQEEFDAGASVVSDVDVTELVRIMKTLERGKRDIFGQVVDFDGKLFVGLRVNPNNENLEPLLHSIKKFREVGADFIQLMPSLNINSIKRIAEFAKSQGLAVFSTVCLVPSIEHAESLSRRYPGFTPPPEFLEELKSGRADEANLSQISAMISEFKKIGMSGCIIDGAGCEDLLRKVITEV